MEAFPCRTTNPCSVGLQHGPWYRGSSFTNARRGHSGPAGHSAILTARPAGQEKQTPPLAFGSRTTPAYYHGIWPGRSATVHCSLNTRHPMTEDEMRVALRGRVAASGGLRAFARSTGVHAGLVSVALNGGAVPPAVLAAAGIERIVTYEFRATPTPSPEDAA